MDTDPRTGLEVLDEDTCWELLAKEPIGRLVAIIDGRIELFPINYAVDDRAVFVRTAPGTKLAALGGEVVFEADDASWMMRSGWSVIVWGRLAAVTDTDELARAHELPLRPWSDTAKPLFLRLDAERITGRRIPPPEFD